jgi:hypothetical protein
VRQTLAALTALSGLLVQPSTAISSLFLTWEDCAGTPQATSDHSFDCSTNSGVHELYCALESPAAIDSVIGIELVIDLEVGESVLPAWWQLGGGACRDGALTADTDLGSSLCDDLWQVLASGGVVSYSPAMPRGGANQARIVVGLGILSSDQRTIEAGRRYGVARLVLRNTATTGGGQCPGCAEAACLSLNSALVRRPPRPEGAPSADVFMEPAAGTAHRATWQGGAAHCAAVPVRHATWGAIKGMYR